MKQSFDSKSKPQSSYCITVYNATVFTFWKALCIDVEDENFFDFHGNLFLENEKILQKSIIPKTSPGALDSCVVYSWVVATLWF